MPAPVDYASIMAAGQGLVPDIQRQMLDRQLANAQTQQVQNQTANLALDAQKQQQGIAEQASFQRDLDAALLAGTPQAIQNLMLRHPQLADKVKPVWEAMEATQRQADLTQAGTIYQRAQAGDIPGAIEMMEARVAADVASGHEDPADAAILAGLKSDNPVEQRAAVQTIGIHVAALTGDKFGETYGKIFPTDAKPGVQKDAEYYLSIGRPDLAKAIQESHADPLVQVTTAAGTDIRPRSEYVGGIAQPGGGDPTSPAPATAPAGYTMPVQGTITSRFGDARDGGARSHDGIDIAAPAGTPVLPVKPGVVIATGSDARNGNFVRVKHPDGTMSGYGHLAGITVAKGAEVGANTPLGTVGATGNATGNTLHLLIRDRRGKAIDPAPLFGGPVRVTSVQQAQKLAAGTRYTTPDGRVFVR